MQDHSSPRGGLDTGRSKPRQCESSGSCGARSICLPILLPLREQDAITHRAVRGDASSTERDDSVWPGFSALVRSPAGDDGELEVADV